jgi:hypothetical protein
VEVHVAAAAAAAAASAAATQHVPLPSFHSAEWRERAAAGLPPEERATFEAHEAEIRAVIRCAPRRPAVTRMVPSGS